MIFSWIFNYFSRVVLLEFCRFRYSEFAYDFYPNLLPRRGLLCTSRDKPWMGQIIDVRASVRLLLFVCLSVCLSRSDRANRLVGYLE